MSGVTERVGRGVERVSTERICRRGLMEKAWKNSGRSDGFEELARALGCLWKSRFGGARDDAHPTIVVAAAIAALFAVIAART